MNYVRTVTSIERSFCPSELHETLTPPVTLAEFMIYTKH